jgi:hypothetical protein
MGCASPGGVDGLAIEAVTAADGCVCRRPSWAIDPRRRWREPVAEAGEHKALIAVGAGALAAGALRPSALDPHALGFVHFIPSARTLSRAFSMGAKRRREARDKN